MDRAQKNNPQYEHGIIEKKWQEFWEKEKVFSPDLKTAKNPYYTLMMFPYPSAEGLHVGNMYAFTGADVHGRYMRMKGKDVFEPIGLDGFGIHSENYAMKVGKHPRKQAILSEKNFYRQLRSTGNGYDWARTLETYDPDYYRWTQWLFIQMFKKGLAYRKKAKVNWCPSDKTVLADEQVIDGKCERDGALVEKRDLEQWFFRITEYSDALLTGLDNIDWPEKIKIAQRNWIGKSTGAVIDFKIESLDRQISVFTTRPDTLWGATFMVLSPEHPIVESLLKGKNDTENDGFDTVLSKTDAGVLKDLASYVETANKKTQTERTEEKEKTGVFSGLYCINPISGEKIPVWVADYVLMGYGTGALFGDAHDARDFEFAKKYKIPLKPTIKTGDSEKDERIKNLEECFTGEGILFDSGEFSGLSSKEAKVKITTWLKDHKAGESSTTYHLRDWLISRQRYWGPPIPMIFCSNCEKNKKGEREDMPGWWTVQESALPVELPDVEDWRPEGSGTSPLANHPEFFEVKCPSCSSSAKRETDVSDTFLDSAWYYLRYLSLGNEKSQKTMSKDIKNDQPLKEDSKGLGLPYDPDVVKLWCPVAIYIGGAEHAVLHLLYVRFVAMVLNNLDNQLQISFKEPFPRFFAHGLIIKEGAKMSKSRGNVVVPDEYIKKYGADSLRMYLMFLGPFSQGGEFSDSGIEGMNRFIRRVWNLFATREFTQDGPEGLRMINKTIKEVTKDIEVFSYNTAIARLMEFYNFISDSDQSWSRETALSYLKLFAPLAPHFTEELFESLSLGEGTIHKSEWPEHDEKYLVSETATIVIQVNGKKRAEIEIDASDINKKEEVESMARKEIEKYLEQASVKKVIYVSGKIINFVI